MPNLRDDSPFSSSSASFNTKFMCMSKLFNTPLNSLPPLSLIKTWEFNDLPNASSGLEILTFFCTLTLSPIHISLLVGYYLNLS